MSTLSVNMCFKSEIGKYHTDIKPFGRNNHFNISIKFFYILSNSAVGYYDHDYNEITSKTNTSKPFSGPKGSKGYTVLHECSM